MSTTTGSTEQGVALSQQDSERKALSTLQWFGIALGVCLVVTLCISAGRWQWSRHVDRDEFIASVNDNYTAPAKPLESFLPTTDAPLDESVVWSQATVTGRYLTEQTALLRNRPINSTPSVHVLVPFQTDNGEVLLVNRGWLPYDGNAERPSTIPAPPSGKVTITVHLRQSEPTSTKNAPSGQVRAINVDQALTAGFEYAGVAAPAQGTYFENAYGALVSESPAPTESVRALPRPSTDPKNHMSYAFQWWVFAIGGASAFVVLFVRDRRLKKYGTQGRPVNPFTALDTALESADAGTSSPSDAARLEHVDALKRQMRTSKAQREKRSRVQEDYEDSLFED